MGASPLNPLPLLLLLLALLLFWLALRLRRRTGLPWATIVSSDMGTRHALERPLFSARYQLTGKPDYLLKQGMVSIPVEVKPGRHATAPYESDLLQLAAYCLLVAETYDIPPPYGILRYAETSFRLRYTPAVRAELLATLAAMQADLAAADCARSHDEPARCRGCGFVQQCDEALIEA